jgi:hypothetical protein
MTAHETHQDANLTAPPTGVASEPTVDAAAVLAREALARRVALLEGLLARAVAQVVRRDTRGEIEYCGACNCVRQYATDTFAHKDDCWTAPADGG